MINILKDMLLIEDQSVFRLYEELIKITNYFIAPVFTISLILEFFGEMNFTEPVKKLFLVVIFILLNQAVVSVSISLNLHKEVLKTIDCGCWFKIKDQT